MPGFYIPDRGFATNSVTSPADEKGKKQKICRACASPAVPLNQSTYGNSWTEYYISPQIKHNPADHFLPRSKMWKCVWGGTCCSIFSFLHLQEKKKRKGKKHLFGTKPIWTRSSVSQTLMELFVVGYLWTALCRAVLCKWQNLHVRLFPDSCGLAVTSTVFGGEPCLGRRGTSADCWVETFLLHASNS